MYKIKFIQKEICNDETDHLYSLIYKFFCSDSKLNYIIRAEYYSENVFAVKFYCKQQRKSKFKYNRVINIHSRLTVLKIFRTCLSIVPILIDLEQSSSFAILSARTIDTKSKDKLTEGMKNNQRFRVYSRFLNDSIGNKTFTHYEYEDFSSYMLVNNSVGNTQKKEIKIKKMFEKTYEFIPDVTN